MSEEKKIGGRAFGETLNVEKFIEEIGRASCRERVCLYV